jgi:hypothetical protein
MMNRTLSILNRSAGLRLLCVEPEGADYWMLPGQEFLLRAEVEAEDGRFELWDNGSSLQVFPSRNMGYISVFADGQELQCGHQRP